MKFSYNWLKDYVEDLPRPEKLAEVLTLHSFEVEEVKKADQDWILNIDILPNRAGDCFSHIGLARECAALLNLKFSFPPAVIVSDNLKIDSLVTVEVKDKIACPRYTALAITDVEVGPSPKWLKSRLEVCGLNSINNIVDAVNYTMLETGQPLHAFDARKLDGNKIIVRFAKEGESIATLDNQKFNLDEKILVVADARKPAAVAGIKGGKVPEIGPNTKIVILEAANFNPQTIRAASKELGLRTDASIRFEHGLDPNSTESSISKAAALIQRVAGGTIKGSVDIYSQKVYPTKIKLDLNYVKNLLGIEIPKAKMAGIFKRLGIVVLNPKSTKVWNIEAPTWRQDIAIPEDLIEEAVRVWGYDQIPAVFPSSALIPPKRNDEVFWGNAAKDILKELGFTEVYNYSFVAKAEKAIEVKNPISSDFKYLRPSLIPNLLKNIEKNSKMFRKVKIFEMGKIFFGGGEKTMLSGLTVGEDFYQLKGTIDTLFNRLGIAGVWYDEFEATPEDSPQSIWQPQKSAEIKVGNAEIGFLGELKHGKGIVCFDLDFEKLQKLATEEHEYKPISKYPAMIRDLAILVPLETRVEQALNVIEISGGILVSDVDLFDIYEGEELPEGMKNLAFRIIYQADDRTLTSKEVDKIHQKIIKTLEKDPLWQVRK